MDKKILKLLNDTIMNANIINCDITMEELTEKYNKILSEYGEERALQALQNTHKSIKEKVKEIDKTFWNSVRYEILKNKGSTPCGNRDLKNMIKNGQINIEGLPNEAEIKRRLIN